MQKLGIDVSRWQGSIDWSKASKLVDFVIIKAGGSDCGCYKDSTFERNYKYAKGAGVPVGCYYFVGKDCTTAKDGEADAKRFYEIIKGKKFEYPVIIDVEATPVSKKAGTTSAVKAFCKYLEKKGYYVAIYASDISGFKDRMKAEDLTAFDKWVARYGSKPKYIEQYGMWQFSSTGSIKGINGHVDLNYAYIDYPQIMKNNHLNGY